MQFLEKAMENVGAHRDIELITTEKKKKKKLFSIRTKSSNYKVFYRKFISNRNEKKQRYLSINLSI